MNAVYSIRNINSDKIYIGSTTDFAGRFRGHRWQLKHNKHHSHLLQKDWNDLGEEYFSYELIEEVKIKEEVFKREQFWFNFFKPEYNASLDARSPMKGMRHSEKTKAQMQESHKANGRCYFIMTDEIKKKISQAKNHIKRPVAKLDENKNEIEKFPSITDAAKSFNGNESSLKTGIGNAIKGGYRANGFYWKYLN